MAGKPIPGGKGPRSPLKFVVKRRPFADGVNTTTIPREPIYSQPAPPAFRPADAIVRNVALFALLAASLPPGEQVYASQQVQPVYSSAGWVQQTSPLLLSPAQPPGEAVYGQQAASAQPLPQQVQRNSAILDLPRAPPFIATTWLAPAPLPWQPLAWQAPNLALTTLALPPASVPRDPVFSRPLLADVRTADAIVRNRALLDTAVVALPPGAAIYGQNAQRDVPLPQQVQRNSALLDLVAALPPGESATEPNRREIAWPRLDDPRRNSALLDIPAAPLPIGKAATDPNFRPIQQPRLDDPRRNSVLLDLPQTFAGVPRDPVFARRFEVQYPRLDEPRRNAVLLDIGSVVAPGYPAGAGDSSSIPPPDQPRPGWITNLLQSTLSTAPQALPPGETAVDPNWRAIVYPRLDDPRRNSALLDIPPPPIPIGKAAVEPNWRGTVYPRLDDPRRNAVLLDIGPAAPLPFFGLYDLAPRVIVVPPPGWITNLLQSTLAPAVPNQHRIFVDVETGTLYLQVNAHNLLIKLG
jgi:hypothetical protein